MTIETKKQTETKERGNDINKKVAMLLLESPLETISMMKMRSKFEQALYQLRLNKIALVTEYRLNSKQYLSLLEMEYTKKKEYFESKINHIPTTKEEYEEGDALFAKINQLSKRFDITKAEEEQLLREQLITIEVIYEEKRKDILAQQKFCELMHKQNCYWKLIDSGRKLFFYKTVPIRLEPGLQKISYSPDEIMVREHNNYGGILLPQSSNNKLYLALPDWEDVPINLISSDSLYEWILRTLERNALTKEVIEMEIEYLMKKD